MRTSGVLNRYRRRIRQTLWVLLVPLALPACDTQNLLSVDLPGRVPEEALDDPALAETLVLSVQADLECAWNMYVAASAVHSDEFIPTSANLNMQEWGARQKTSEKGGGECSGAYNHYYGLQTAYFMSNDIFDRLQEFGLPNQAAQQATVRAYGGYALIALGEGYCEMALEGGPLMTPEEVLEVARTKFTEAIELATAANEESILNMALIGRARASLRLEDFSAVLEDAARIPPGYVQNATRDASSTRRQNALYNNMVRNRHQSVSPNYHSLEWMGVPDNRVEVRTDGHVGFDTATPHFYPTKIANQSTPVPLASYKEAQLFIAEASVRSGDLSTARRIINERHALAGLPPYDAAGTATQDEVLAHVIQERSRELFAEGGHRLNDMLRFRGTALNIPFQGEPGSIHPDGFTQAGLVYGNVTCWPLLDAEKLVNPNITS